jgi:hypothetical protein
MPGIWDKFKKFGQNLWNGINNGWNAVKTFAPTVLNTIAPLLKPYGQQIANTIGKGIDMGKRVESTLGNMRSPQSSAVRRSASVLSQQIYWEGT